MGIVFDDHGRSICCAAGKAAWFRDSEGNVLTITQLGYEH